jgi:hypothetical protein
MPIEHEGLSGRRSTSRMGKIRLGKKARNAKGVEYPEKLDYFRFDPEDETLVPTLAEIFGEKPRRLSVMFASGDRELIFPQYLKKYGLSGLLCKGTGHLPDEAPKPVLMRVTAVDETSGEVTIDETFLCDPDTCPDYQDGRCKRLASLSGFVLCDYPTLRTWQIDTTSKISIENLNSRLDDLEKLAASIGRSPSVAGIPLVLTLNPVQVRARDKQGNLLKKKQTVYVMDLDVDTSRLMEGRPSLAFLGRLAPLDEATAPEGLYARSQVEGADLVQERVEMLEARVEEDADPVLANLPDDIAEGIRVVGLSTRQVRALVRRYLPEGAVELGEDGKKKLTHYLSGLADLKLAGDEASLTAILKDLDNDAARSGDGETPDEAVVVEDDDGEADDDPGPDDNDAGFRV